MNIEHLLKEISEVSDLRYQEGGVYYTYEYFHRCAHVNSDKGLIGSNRKIGNSEFSDKGVESIEAFIKFSLGEHHTDKISNEAPKYLSQMLEMLNEFDRAKVTNYYVDDYDCSASITIEAVTNNNGHKWALNWSID